MKDEGTRCIFKDTASLFSKRPSSVFERSTWSLQKGKGNICIASCSLMSPQIFDDPAGFYHSVTGLLLEADTVGAALHFFRFFILSIFHFPLMSTAHWQSVNKLATQGQTSPGTSRNDYDLSWVNMFTCTFIQSIFCWTCAIIHFFKAYKPDYSFNQWNFRSVVGSVYFFFLFRVVTHAFGKLN